MSVLHLVALSACLSVCLLACCLYDDRTRREEDHDVTDTNGPWSKPRNRRVPYDKEEKLWAPTLFD